MLTNFPFQISKRLTRLSVKARQRLSVAIWTRPSRRTSARSNRIRICTMPHSTPAMLNSRKHHNSTDAQFRSDHFDAAGVWFAKAIAINANRETAYRYWGDALDAQGKTEPARDKFVEAIIAEPYGRRSYVGLTQWAERHKVNMGHPKIEPPNSTRSQDGKTTLAIDPRTLNSSDGSSNWLVYNLTRIAWSKGDFFKNYPDEKVYRHSLKEEAAALRMVAEGAARDLSLR